jgi:hypothetical protein
MNLYIASFPVDNRAPSGLLSLAVIDDTGRAFYAERIGYLPENLCPAGQANLSAFSFANRAEEAQAHVGNRENRLRPYLAVNEHQLGESVTAVISHPQGIATALAFWLEPYPSKESLVLHGVAAELQFARLNLGSGGLLGKLDRTNIKSDLDHLLAAHDMQGVNLVQVAYGKVPPAPAGSALELAYAIRYMFNSLIAQPAPDEPTPEPEPEPQAIATPARKARVRPQDKVKNDE